MKTFDLESDKEKERAQELKLELMRDIARMGFDTEEYLSYPCKDLDDSIASVRK